MRVSGFLIVFLILSGCGKPLTMEEKIDEAHREFRNGYFSSFLPHEGETRGDDYRYCMRQNWNRSVEKHEFCSWHAGIGKYHKKG
jgi:guanylate kinase